jgi:hypothetical protein
LMSRISSMKVDRSGSGARRQPGQKYSIRYTGRPPSILPACEIDGWVAQPRHQRRTPYQGVVVFLHPDTEQGARRPLYT